MNRAVTGVVGAACLTMVPAAKASAGGLWFYAQSLRATRRWPGQPTFETTARMEADQW